MFPQVYPIRPALQLLCTRYAVRRRKRHSVRERSGGRPSRAASPPLHSSNRDGHGPMHTRPSTQRRGALQFEQASDRLGVARPVQYAQYRAGLPTESASCNESRAAAATPGAARPRIPRHCQDPPIRKHPRAVPSRAHHGPLVSCSISDSDTRTGGLLYREYVGLEVRIGRTLSPTRIPLPQMTGVPVEPAATAFSACDGVLFDRSSTPSAAPQSAVPGRSAPPAPRSQSSFSPRPASRGAGSRSPAR